MRHSIKNISVALFNCFYYRMPTQKGDTVLQYLIIPVTHYQQNCSLLWCDETQQAVVVDPGGNIDRIQKAIAERGLQLVNILLTHGHLDHVGGAVALSTATGIAIEGPHVDDNFWLNMLPQQAQMMGFSPAEAFLSTHYFEEGDSVSFGNITLQIFHCPGHTPGHIVFFEPQSKLAIVGDVLFRGSIGRSDFPRGNYDQLVNTIRTKLWPLGDDVQFIPGHGPMSTFGYERLHNAFVADKKFG